MHLTSEQEPESKAAPSLHRKAKQGKAEPERTAPSTRKAALNSQECKAGQSKARTNSTLNLQGGLVEAEPRCTATSVLANRAITRGCKNKVMPML